MADDVILVEYQAKIDKFEASLRALEKSMLDAEATAKKSSAAAAGEYQKQTGIINNLKSRVNELTAARDRSNNPAAIQRYNKLIDESNAKVQNLTKSTQEVTKSQGGLSQILGTLGPQMLAAFSVGTILNFQKSIVDITAKFQKYEAVLTNTLGSNSAAQKTLKDIQEFASTTPFSVDELTASYIKLANQGFKPTAGQLRQLGDLASSTGKSFDQLTEGILDAQTGQFERLKEFGIVASKEGDKVNFSFKGVKTQVDFTSKAIQQYVLGLGDLKGVTGSMAAISGTLEGKISNLGDTYDQLLLAIGKQESGGISQGIAGLSALLAELTKAASGQTSVFDGYIDAMKAYVAPFIDVATSIGALLVKMGLLENSGSIIKGVFNTIGFVIKFATVPIRVFVETIATLIDMVSLNFDKVGEDFKKLGNIITLDFFKAEAGAGMLKAKVAERIKVAKDEGVARVGLIKALTEELKQLKEKEENALTEIEIKALQKRQKIVQAELDRLQGKKNKDAKEQADKEKKALEDAIKEYADMVKNASENDAYERAAIDKKEKESLKESEKEYHEFVSNQAEADADARKKRDEQEIADLKKKQAIKKQILATAIDVSGTLINEFNQRQLDNDNAEIESERSKNNTETENLIASLEKRKEQGLLSETSFASQKAAILRKSARQESELKKRAFEAQKQADLTGILINTAVAIAKSFAVYGFTPAGVIAAAAAAAEGAVQYAFVSSKKTPKFKDGVVDYKGKGTGTSDENHVMISNRESIITAKGTMKHKRLLEAVNNDTVERYLTTDYLKPIMAKQKKEQDRETSMLRSALNLALANQVDTSHLERLTKRNGTVNLGNAREIGKIIASEINGNNNPEMK